MSRKYHIGVDAGSAAVVCSETGEVIRVAKVPIDFKGTEEEAIEYVMKEVTDGIISDVGRVNLATSSLLEALEHRRGLAKVTVVRIFGKWLL